VAPNAPTNLTATSAGTSQINLAWTASSTSGVAYSVYGSTTAGFTPSSSNRLATGVSTTSYSATGLTGSTTYYFRVTATKGGVESTDSNQASAATSGGTSCHVVYTVSSQWGNGFNGAFSIENTGSTTMTSWTLTWAWAGNQEMTQSWNANYKQTGANVTLTNMSYNASIAPGATLNGMGFGASYSGTNSSPTTFYVNGTLCH
jgi:cellulose 1,4-beta-cellobiosidase